MKRKKNPERKREDVKDGVSSAECSPEKLAMLTPVVAWRKLMSRRKDNCWSLVTQAISNVCSFIYTYASIHISTELYIITH